MKKTFLLMPAVLTILLVGCGGAEFTEEKTALSTATQAMEAFASSIASADSPELVTQALGSFTSTFENIMPAIKKMKTDHADWETSPPDALKDTIAGFKAATEKFKGAMPAVMQMAGQHADNAELQGAVDKFKNLVAGL